MLAVAGFVLSLVAFAWTFALVFIRLPRVSVETRKHTRIVPGTENADRIELTVINRGSEAVTICNIGLKPEDPSVMARDYSRDQIDYPDMRPNSSSEDKVLFPARIEGHGALRWTYMPEQLGAFEKGTVVKGYAIVYRSIHWFWLKDDALTERTILSGRTQVIG